jgi:hypothetical protein
MKLMNVVRYEDEKSKEGSKLYLEECCEPNDEGGYKGDDG